MEGQAIADLQGQNQFAGLAEQNSSEDEGYEESFMGEGQPDPHSEEEEKFQGRPRPQLPRRRFCGPICAATDRDPKRIKIFIFVSGES